MGAVLYPMILFDLWLIQDVDIFGQKRKIGFFPLASGIESALSR
jgi:hypothetical protein